MCNVKLLYAQQLALFCILCFFSACHKKPQYFRRNVKVPTKGVRHDPYYETLSYLGHKVVSGPIDVPIYFYKTRLTPKDFVAPQLSVPSATESTCFARSRLVNYKHVSSSILERFRYESHPEGGVTHPEHFARFRWGDESRLMHSSYDYDDKPHLM